MKEEKKQLTFDDSAIRGKHFTCVDRCAMCCRLFRIPLFSEDIIRIERFLNIKREQFCEIIRDVDSAKILTSSQKIKELYTLKTKNDGSCMFLDDQTLRCSIYDVRPLACQLYPLRFYRRSDDVIEIMLDPMSEMFCAWDHPNGQEFSEKDYLHFWKSLEESFSSKDKK